MTSRPLPTALACLLFAVPLPAQTDDLARVRAEFGEVHTARIAAAIRAGVQAGLPRGLLVDKAVEGAAKHMQPDVVLTAVRTLSDELLAARDLVGPDADPETLEKTADALRHGVDRDLLVELHRERPGELPLLVVAIEDLLHAGVRLEVAQSIIRDATVRGLRGDDVLILPATVRRLVREGRTPGQAASSVRAQLRRGPPFSPSALPGAPGPAARTRTGVPSIPPF